MEVIIRILAYRNETRTRFIGLVNKPAKIERIYYLSLFNNSLLQTKLSQSMLLKIRGVVVIFLDVSMKYSFVLEIN